MDAILKRLLAVLLLACPLWGATPTVAQKTATSTASGSAVSTASITTTTGHAVAVACGGGATTTTYTVSDGTNTYTAVASGYTTQATEGSQRWFVAKNITGVAHIITCTSNGSGLFLNIFVYEIAGASTSAPVDVPTGAQTGGASGTSSATPSFALPTTTFAHDLLLFAANCGNACSAGTGVDSGNSQTDGSGDESETYSKSATGTYTGAFSQTASTYSVVGVAITDGVSGGATCSNLIAMSGAGCK